MAAAAAMLPSISCSVPSNGPSPDRSPQTQEAGNGECAPGGSARGTTVRRRRAPLTLPPARLQLVRLERKEAGEGVRGRSALAAAPAWSPDPGVLVR